MARQSFRAWFQAAFAALSNGYWAGFRKGRIYSGPTKQFCLPGLNCYSCPGALGACPIGALQAVLGSRQFMFSCYVIGFLMVVGALCGRFVCGWLCPFGLVQDLLHKIPWPRKLRALPGERFLSRMRYVVLAVLVVLLPLFLVDALGQGAPWFCKLLCPAGTLRAGIPLVIANPILRELVGWLYAWKVAILVFLLLLSVVLYRPFCRYLCPLGAIYGPFNRIALYRYRVDLDACTSCGKCRERCPLDIAVYQTPNSSACIRCGICKQICPEGAVHSTLEELLRRQKSI